MNFKMIKQALRIAIPAGLVMAVIGLSTPALAGGGHSGNDGIKKRMGSRMVVDQLYRDMLDRPADDAAIKLYGGALEEGKSPEIVRKMIAFSPEAGLVINDHVKKFMGREATDGEMQKIRKELNDGATIAQLDAKLAKQAGKGHGKHK